MMLRLLLSADVELGMHVDFPCVVDNKAVGDGMLDHVPCVVMSAITS